ncbi:MAG: peroxiredoxin [Bacteroidota bacterium]
MKTTYSRVVRLVGLSIVFLSVSFSLHAQETLTVGERAPEFTLPAATKDTILFSGVSLSEEIKKSPVILAFYPADWSGGCTKEMCTMRDNFSSLSSLGVTVLGISGDYVFSHEQWAKHLGLQFTLLSDHDHAVAKAYHTYNPKSGFNVRSVWVVGKDGRIDYMDPAYNSMSEESFNKLKTALASLK